VFRRWWIDTEPEMTVGHQTFSDQIQKYQSVFLK
jgi:hypothetical protein